MDTYDEVVIEVNRGDAVSRSTLFCSYSQI